MPASTRASTGSSKPRIVRQIENVVAPKKRTTITANTSKLRTNSSTAVRVVKPKNTTATTGPRTKIVKKRRTPTEKAKDKAVGNVTKLVGEVEGKSEKKAAGTRKENGSGSTRRGI